MFDIEGVVPAVVTTHPDQLGHSAGTVAAPAHLENVMNRLGGLGADKAVIEIGMGRERKV